MGGTRHRSAKLRVTMAEAAEILGVSVEVAEMIATLRKQVQAERQAHAETRRLLAAALECIPPQLEPRESPTVGAEGPERGTVAEEAATVPRSWWRRLFEA